MSILAFVKNNIIMTVPYSPHQKTNTHSYLLFRFFVNPIEPISKHICNIGWWGNVKNILNSSPNNPSDGTIKE
jgi:hypothetical protein